MNRIHPFLSKCPSSQLQQCLKVSCHAALSAGLHIKNHYNQPHSITLKGAINLVTETDIAAERIIVEILTRDTEAIPVMTEEQTSTHSLETQQLWVVDPLDGTTNFAHGFPFFAVSIALLDSGRPEVAVIYAPLFDELFYAVRGCGAWMNGQSIRVTSTDRLIEALIGTGFPYEIDKNLPDVIRRLQAMLPQTRDVRRAGAAALDLAYVACGRLDGFYETHLQPWDTAAGWLLVEEAGGQVTTFSGAPYSPFYQEILASNGPLHRQLLERIR
jgi:myo-inositol-1(or 4)-monophosphatase